MRTISILALLIGSAFLRPTVLAETLSCEFWSGIIPVDHDSAAYQEARAKCLLAEVKVEKPNPAIGTLLQLMWRAGAKSGLSEESYRHRVRVSVFRRYPSGRVALIVDGKHASSVPLGSVYDFDVIVFHEPVIGEVAEPNHALQPTRWTCRLSCGQMPRPISPLVATRRQPQKWECNATS